MVLPSWPTLRTRAERAVWFDGYVRTYLERDLQDLAAISALPDFRRLMRAACLRLGQLLSQTELARDVGLPQPTVHRWLDLLETSYLLVRLPAYAVNRTCWPSARAGAASWQKRTCSSSEWGGTDPQPARLRGRPRGEPAVP